MSTSNLHLYPSAFTNESRILKETRSIIDRGLMSPVHIAAVWRDGLAETEDIDSNRKLWRVRLLTSRFVPGKLGKIVGLAEWYVRVFARYQKSDASCVSCHSLTTLPLGLLFKLTRGSSVIYTTHELETETNNLKGFRQRLAKALERRLIKYVDLTTVVSPSIGEWYQREYGLAEVPVIRNIPHRASIPTDRSTYLRDYCKLSPGNILFIYQGLLARGRNIELLIDVFSNAAPNRHIVFLGYGPLEAEILTFTSMHSNIHFHKAVSPDNLLEITASADVGIFVLDQPCLSYKFCLPNKLFEYLLSGLPVLVSDLPDMAQIVRETNAGWTVEIERGVLSELINSITKEAIEDKRNNALATQTNYGWEVEEQVLEAAYRRNLGSRICAPQSA